MIRYIQKRMAVKTYVDVLPIMLRKKYGKRKHYSAQQVRQTLSDSTLSDRFMNVAFAIYVSRSDFDFLKQTNSSLGNYSDLRSMVAKRYFKGNTKFSIHDILKRSSYQVNQSSNGTFFTGHVAGGLADPDLDGDI